MRSLVRASMKFARHFLGSSETIDDFRPDLEVFSFHGEGNVNCDDNLDPTRLYDLGRVEFLRSRERDRGEAE